jgi:hypothetical protein
MALRHLPSGYGAVNRTWMWAAFLALNCSVFLQSLAGVDTGPGGRAHGKRLRRELIAVPARVLRHARLVVVRVAPEHRNGVFADAWQALRAPVLRGTLRVQSHTARRAPAVSSNTARSLTSPAPAPVEGPSAPQPMVALLDSRPHQPRRAVIRGSRSDRRGPEVTARPLAGRGPNSVVAEQ